MPDDPDLNACLLHHIALLQARLDAQRRNSTALLQANSDLAQANARLRDVQTSLDEITLAHDDGWASAARRTRDLRQLRDRMTSQQAAVDAARAEETLRFERSLSWRITAPLRGVRRGLAGLAGKLRGLNRPIL